MQTQDRYHRRMPGKATTVHPASSASMPATPTRKAITPGRHPDSVDSERLKDKTRAVVRAQVKVLVKVRDKAEGAGERAAGMEADRAADKVFLTSKERRFTKGCWTDLIPIMMAFSMTKKEKPCVNTDNNDAHSGQHNKGNPLMVVVDPVPADSALAEALLMVDRTNSATKTISIQSH
jgi:hypothetical protein